MRFSATVVAENWARSAWQLTQVNSLSGDAASHLEQVCIIVLLEICVYFTALEREKRRLLGILK
jgi:hypothetical protein